MHIGVIMDGNRRWARSRGLLASDGHKTGVKALRCLVQASIARSIDYVTVYAFSSENWKRSKTELDFLFTLLTESAIKELDSLKEEGVKVCFIGDLSVFEDTKLERAIKKLEDETKSNTKLVLNIALNYGSASELKQAANTILNEVNLDEIINIDEQEFSKYLMTSSYPDIDLVIRTGGKQRLSNFLLWQSASAKLFFTDTYWPDFDESLLDSALQLLGLNSREAVNFA